jgi:hypothetical protein
MGPVGKACAGVMVPKLKLANPRTSITATSRTLTARSIFTSITCSNATLPLQGSPRAVMGVTLRQSVTPIVKPETSLILIDFPMVLFGSKADLSIFKKHANCDPEERTGRRTAQLAISRMQSRGLEELRTWQAQK